MDNRQIASYMEASGEVLYNMTNNYMFRYILQKNKKVLKGLICSLLHLRPEEIMKVEITNPINLSGDITGKEFILDINVMLNDNTRINLEMQVANEYNWPERSLSYLCRSFDQLYRGQKYEEVLPVIHIGFLDFTLHPKAPEFYATYKMLNVRNHFVYSDKFILSVVNLNRIELATDEDKSYDIDYWASIFKAKTWEEIQMLAKDNEYLQEAAESLYVANADEIVRQQCRAREDAERLQRTLERDNKLLKEQLNSKDKELDETRNLLSKERQRIAELEAKLAQLNK
jgi:predicted transposase/invertase (TIGR01784 family)